VRATFISRASLQRIRYPREVSPPETTDTYLQGTPTTFTPIQPTSPVPGTSPLALPTLDFLFRAASDPADPPYCNLLLFVSRE
jgi:hypothetical protein